ncbi:MAG: AraC family transcriptional regulator [Eubacterium sp.]
MDHQQVAKISAAITFIEDHLNEKLSLDRVAAAVHYSKYHLHRLFTDTVGLTMHDYIKRRQLTEAAKLLVFSTKPIVDIAAVAGYGSQQAFTNIFTAMYKQSPHKYREKERFYPLQLKFKLEGAYRMLNGKKIDSRQIVPATVADIPCWMALVRLVIDGFPHLHEDEYIPELMHRIKEQQALILKDGPIAVGIMLFSPDTGSIDFMGTHPLYRKRGIPKAFLEKVMNILTATKEISITTYRSGDKADTGHRQAIKDLGFAEAELLTEFNYPTQRFILKRKAAHDD